MTIPVKVTLMSISLWGRKLSPLQVTGTEVWGVGRNIPGREKSLKQEDKKEMGGAERIGGWQLGLLKDLVKERTVWFGTITLAHIEKLD